MKTISVIGLGKVGLAFASCLVKAGYKVIGVDINKTLIDELNSRHFDGAEPFIKERLESFSQEQFFATSDIFLAIQASDVTFVAVATPSNTKGGFSLKYLLKVFEQIGQGLRKKDNHHVVSIISTILPSSSDNILIPKLERDSGKKIGKGLGYCYNPAFIALGEVVKGFEKPDYLLIGEDDNDKLTSEIIIGIHQNIIKKDIPIARMSYVDAELTKIASNTHETMRVSFANMLCALCNQVPGANVDNITRALSYRLGGRFFKGATPYGGPCWPRDNIALSVFMDLHGISSILPKSVDAYNKEHADYIFSDIVKRTEIHEKIGVIGLGYKTGVDFFESSFAIELTDRLIEHQRKLIVWDPHFFGVVEDKFVLKATKARGLEDCINLSDTIIIAQPLQELNLVNSTLFNNKKVIDCWRSLPEKIILQLSTYVPLGIGEKHCKVINESDQRAIEEITA